uniref:NADH-ubiquinone oxidoreductase chain 4L n=1 Tax=Brachidontes exustus TaxID=40254 RepID=A0A0U1V5X8_BRAEX|nr:NADH dehydrogenase subunit 4L [Brachidontes exustus]AIM58711.1 NADH dehydrogenase subunit 4L [Brachidontes exustus]
MKVFISLFFVLGVFITLYQRTHLISVFLGMEFITLSVIAMSAVSMTSMSCFVLLVMCMAVCEASVALALIVSMVRVSGSDKSVNLILDKS